ncbi:MAG: hypothetical protein GF311_28605 [Candidatus Lokiarchaeota archaeon]|nr:hypothetical protein [Candidatus Lokiarchaeota archaeon]
MQPHRIQLGIHLVFYCSSTHLSFIFPVFATHGRVAIFGQWLSIIPLPYFWAGQAN